MGRDFLGITWSTTMFISAICAPIGGFLVDRYGVKKVMLFVSLSNFLSILTVLILHNPLGYFIGNGLLGGLVGLGASTTYVLISDWFKHHRAKAMAINGSSASLGLAVLTPILVSLTWLNWIKVYVILLIINVLFIPLIAWFIRSNKVDDLSIITEEVFIDSRSMLSKWTDGLRFLSQIIRRPIFIVVIFAILTCGISMGTVEMNLVAIHQQAQVPGMMIASSLSILGLLEVFGGIIFSILLDHKSRTKALAVLYLLRTAAFTLLIFHFPVTPILFSLIFGATYVGAVPGAILVANEALGSGSGQKKLGMQTGMLLFVHHIGGVLASLSSGFIFDYTHHYQALIAVNLILCLMVTAGYAWISKSRPASTKVTHSDALTSNIE